MMLRRSAALLGVTLLASLLPEAEAQRVAGGPRSQTLLEPQALVTHLPTGVAIPRAEQRRLDGADGGRPAIVLTGYWPPSNEAVRKFSTDPIQNPGGWQGQNWEGRGYDVYAFFPEFTPPSCSFCGKGTGDLEVDYQDTVADFWPLTDSVDPVGMITFSRGFPDMNWEFEMNQFNRTQWIGDYQAPVLPNPSPPDTGFPADGKRLSSLPVEALVNRINAAQIGTTAYICYSGDGGGFLSEFIAYLGTWYRALHSDPSSPDWCVAAGHVHVGGNLPWNVAQAAAEESVRGLIDYLDAVLLQPCETPTVYCTPKPSSLGCMPTIESVGFPSLAGESFRVRASQIHRNTQGLIAFSQGSATIPFQGGTLCIQPPILRTPVQPTGTGTGNCGGELSITLSPAFVATHGFAAGQRYYSQAWTRDTGDPFGSSLSNGLEFLICP